MCPLNNALCEFASLQRSCLPRARADSEGYRRSQAANAGGVAVSGLEMAQNSARLSWSSEEVDGKLKARSCICTRIAPAQQRRISAVYLLQKHWLSSAAASAMPVAPCLRGFPFACYHFAN